MKYFVSLIFLTATMAFASEQYCNGKTKRDAWGFYYPNGKVVTDSWGTYYPNGKPIADSWGKYYPNGRQVLDSWGIYYPNGKVIADSWGCYSPRGDQLSCDGNRFRVRAFIEDFGSVIVQINPKTFAPGQFEFHQTAEGSDVFISIDFSTDEIIDVELVCR